MQSETEQIWNDKPRRYALLILIALFCVAPYASPGRVFWLPAGLPFPFPLPVPVPIWIPGV